MKFFPASSSPRALARSENIEDIKERTRGLPRDSGTASRVVCALWEFAREGGGRQGREGKEGDMGDKGEKNQPGKVANPARRQLNREN